MMATSAPEAANCAATASPMPLLPPVTMAARPARETCISVSDQDVGRGSPGTARRSTVFVKPASSRRTRLQESPAFWRNPVVGGGVLAEQPAEKPRPQLRVVDQA